MGTIAISKNGTVIYQKSIGSARIGGAPADANTEYRIGSCTKLFTATLVFQLMEEKRLSIGDKLSAFFPELPNAKAITIGNLLNHRSGLAGFIRNTDFDGWKEHPKKTEELLALISSRPPDFEPNARADYNNSNYLVLSLKGGRSRQFRGAGAIVSTPTDMLTFVNAMFSGKLLGDASLHAMETLTDGYGMGMFPFDIGSHPGVGHNGKTEGFAASLTY
jgi:CubicO group peptidase (beta-lactamase class C family)